MCDEFLARLDEQFPYGLFFLSKHTLALRRVAYCYLPPSGTGEAPPVIAPKALYLLLARRWFPPMKYMAKFAGLGDQETNDLRSRAMA